MTGGFGLVDNASEIVHRHLPNTTLENAGLYVLAIFVACVQLCVQTHMLCIHIFCFHFSCYVVIGVRFNTSYCGNVR